MLTYILDESNVEKSYFLIYQNSYRISVYKYKLGKVYVYKSLMNFNISLLKIEKLKALNLQE